MYAAGTVSQTDKCPAQLSVVASNRVRPALNNSRWLKLAFHDADTDTDTGISARILADTSDMRDFL